MATVRELVTRLGFQVDTKKLDQFDRSVAKTSKKLNSLGNGLASVGKKMTTFVTLPILGLGAAFVKSASDAEETFSKFNTVFSSIQTKANETANTLANNFGLSEVNSRKLLGDTADLLTGFNFSQEAALDLSNQVNQLAVDLASFTNYSGGAEGASQALTKALLGERESIKLLGIAILEEDVKQRVRLNRARGIRFETERQAKAYATLQLAQEQSKNAIGDFARTQESFANQLRIFKAELSNVSIELGQMLLPIAKDLLSEFRNLLKAFRALSPESKKNILVAAGIAAALGPILFIVGKLIVGIGLLTQFGPAAVAAIAPIAVIFIKVLAIVALVSAALYGIYWLYKDYVRYSKGEGSKLPGVWRALGKAVDYVKGLYDDLVLVFKHDVIPALKVVKSIADAVWEKQLEQLNMLVKAYEKVVAAMQYLNNLRVGAQNYLGQFEFVQKAREFAKPSITPEQAAQFRGNINQQFIDLLKGAFGLFTGLGNIDLIRQRASQIRNGSDIGPQALSETNNSNSFSIIQKFYITGSGNETDQKTALVVKSEMEKVLRNSFRDINSGALV